MDEFVDIDRVGVKRVRESVRGIWLDWNGALSDLKRRSVCDIIAIYILH